MHEAGDRRDHHQHHGGERVDAERPGGLQRAGIDEARELDARFMAFDAHLVEREPGERRGDQHEARGDHFAPARADQASKEAGKDRTDQREEYNGLIHLLARLTFQEVNFGDIDGAAVAEVDDNDGQADGSFGGGDG